ncbi:DUF6705 family protein [Pedobacter sp. R-06]|uniref:DUF6705 family protein n=1 Tax=Pedobacter sp. R-06 TaxID=3404051 RepID=UPI003CF3B3DD
MKKTFLIFGIILLLYNCAGAQQYDDSDPLNKLDTVQMNKFAGTWQWKSRDTSFTLLLKKWKAGEGLYMVVGWYKYTVKGKTVIDRLDSAGKGRYSGFVGMAMKGNDSLKFTFTDITRDESRGGNLSFIAGNPNRVRFLSEKDPKPRTGLKAHTGLEHVFTEKIPAPLNITMKRTKQ